MSETKHTPGPWSQMPAFAFGLSKQKDPTKDDIVIGPHEHDAKAVALVYRDNIEDAANARLIAAAPELLSGLKDVFKMMDEKLIVRDISRDHEPNWGGLMMGFVTRLKFMHDAIAKAEGSDLSGTSRESK